MSTKRTNKKMLAARVLCTLLLGTYLVGGYGEQVAWGASAESTQIFEDGAHGDKSKVASAWGSNTTANDTDSTAFGANTKASGEYSTAFGNGTVASGSIATAWGNSAKAYGPYSTAFGKGTAGDKDDNNKGELATAWGDSTVASGDTATVWGYHAKASGDFSTAFGSYTKASGMNSTAFGSYTKASGKNSTAFGDTTEACGENATAWGIKAKAYGVNSTSFGANTVADGHGATAFGGSSMALGFCNTAWGYATQAGQLLYGSDKKVAYIVDYKEGETTKYKIVDYNSEEKKTLKDGFNSYWDAYSECEVKDVDQATAWGSGAKATDWHATAFGFETIASGKRSTAFGQKSEASGESATAWGGYFDGNVYKGGTASGTASTAFGVETEASGFASTAFGSETTASGGAATAFGAGAEALGIRSTAFGAYTMAGGPDSTAFGVLTKASGQESTAFGAGTKAIGQGSTAFGANTQAGQLLYGTTEVTIKSYTDTVSGETKYMIVDAQNGTMKEEGFTTYWSAYNDTDLTKMGAQATAFGQGTRATGDASTAFGIGTEASGSGATAWGGYVDGLDYVKGGTASGDYSTAFGLDTTASGDASTAFGIYTEATGKGAVAWGVGEKGVGITLAHGESSTAFGKKSRAFGDNSLAALGGITGVGSIASLDGVTWVNFVPGTGEGAVAIGEGATAEASYTYAIGKNAKVLDAKTENAIAIGNDTSVTAVGGVALGSKAVASVDKDVAGYDPSTGATSTDTSGAWKSTHAAISIGTADGSVTRQITGVAAGSKDTDAVNVAQLKAAADAKLDKTVFNDYKAATAATLGLMQNAITQNADDISDLQTNKLDKAVYEADKADTKAALDGKANVALDNITEDGKTVIKDLAKGAVNVVGYGPVSVAKSDVSGVDTYTVSVKTDGKVESGDEGIMTGGKVFTETRVSADGNYIKSADSAAKNLEALDTAVGTTADGNYVKASDSVGENLGALDAELAALTAGTGTGLAEVSHRIDNMDSKVEKVGAGAAALAALHPMDTDGKFSMAAGFGNYRSANAMALGLFYRPTDQVMFSMGGSMGNGENLLNVGVSFALDKGVTTSKAAMARKINALEEQNSAILEENKAIRAENAEQKAEIQELKEALARIEAKLAK